MIVAIDVGYSAVKVVRGSSDNERDRATFPSVVGTPDQSRFGLSDQQSIMLLKPANVLVGKGAIAQSRFEFRREDRNWITSDTWYHLFLAGLCDASTATSVPVKVVTGLPLAFLDDRDTMKERLIGEHTVQIEGRPEQRFIVTDCKVLPQPFGALLYQALDRDGEWTDERLRDGKVGVIDVGGKTTNVLHVAEMNETRRKSVSVSTGVWNVVRAMSDFLDTRYPGLDLRDHEIVDVIRKGTVTYKAASVDLQGVIQSLVAPFANEVVSKATQLWNGAANLDAILVTGGGAHLMGGTVIEHFGFGQTVDEPVFANALGYLRFGRRFLRV